MTNKLEQKGVTSVWMGRCNGVKGGQPMPIYTQGFGLFITNNQVVSAYLKKTKFIVHHAIRQ